MIEVIPDSLRIRTMSGLVRCEGSCCDCEEEFEFELKTYTDPEEMLYHVYEAAGFDEEGFCPECSGVSAAEVFADNSRRGELALA